MGWHPGPVTVSELDESELVELLELAVVLPPSAETRGAAVSTAMQTSSITRCRAFIEQPHHGTLRS